MQTEPHISSIPIVDSFVSGGRVIPVHCSRDYQQAIADYASSVAKRKPVVQSYVRRIPPKKSTPGLQNTVTA